MKKERKKVQKQKAEQNVKEFSMKIVIKNEVFIHAVTHFSQIKLLFVLTFITIQIKFT